MAVTRDLLLERGFGGTSVDAICQQAGLSKGSFFHHFKSKEEAASATLQWFFEVTKEAMSSSGYAEKQDAVERLTTYLDGVAVMMRAASGSGGCLLGAMALELSSTHPEIRRQIDSYFGLWADRVAQLLQDALGDDDDERSRSLANHFVASLEGGFLLAGTKQDACVAQASVQHFRTYVMQIIQQECKAV